jgi:hypothetical protein
VGQFHNDAEKTMHHQGHEESLRTQVRGFPSRALVTLVVSGFAK